MKGAALCRKTTKKICLLNPHDKAHQDSVAESQENAFDIEDSVMLVVEPKTIRHPDRSISLLTEKSPGRRPLLNAAVDFDFISRARDLDLTKV